MCFVCLELVLLLKCILFTDLWVYFKLNVFILCIMLCWIYSYNVLGVVFVINSLFCDIAKTYLMLAMYGSDDAQF